MRRSALVIILLIVLGGIASADEARLLRFPDLSAERVAFVYAGDIYTAPREGGQAVRLTSHEGLELFPKFSPDASTIAFTGEYDGDQSVYVIPLAGGEPTRLTFHPGVQNLAPRHGPENIVMGWLDDQHVYFRSRKETFDSWEGRIYSVPVTGGLPRVFPMASAGFTSFSPDRQKIAYCPIFRDFRTWKRYMGGMAQDVWIFDLERLEAEKITDWKGTDNMPMWYGDKIYFNSDRTGTLNIYSYDLTTRQTAAVTDFTEYDVRWPSLGADGIIFENGGYLYVMDLPSEEYRKIEIQLAMDYPWMRPEWIDVSDDISEFDVSPDGKRAAFRARGDVFTVPAKHGNTRNLTKTSGANERNIAWSPDGKWLAYVSDKSGEDELYLTSHDATETRQLITGGDVWKYQLAWSPDSKTIVFSDKALRLFAVDVASGKVTKLDQAKKNEIRGYAFSPDSRYVCYNKQLDNGIYAIFMYSFDDGTIHQVTPGKTHDYGAVFDPDGKYLYFLSQRDFNPILSAYEFQFVNQAITNLFMIVLADTTESPFAPKSDEVSVASDTTKEDADTDEKKEKKDGPPAVDIDFDGIYDREIAIDVPAGNYGGLAAISGALFYSSAPMYGLRGRVTDEPSELHKYDIEKQKEHVFAEDVSGYVVTPDGSKMIVNKQGSYHIIGTSGDKASFDDNRVDVSGMEALVDRKAEYVQMFEQAWRMNRDFFYHPDMHGVDWPAMEKRYRPLVDYAANRFDLTYIIGEMIGELCCSHTYTGGGDQPRLQSSGVGLLGCDFEVDERNNRIRISRILQGENWDQDLRSPLTQPGEEVAEGEYLLAIDGTELTGDVNPYSRTVNTVGRTVTLTVNDSPTMDGSREVTVKPIASETSLRYYNWVIENNAYVDSVSNNRVGYVHIPDMGGYGLTRFVKMFYHQMRRPGLIIDVRYNGGGFVSGLILNRLRREVAAMSNSRTMGYDRDPGSGLYAHMITLQNQFSCSDGDFFPYFFREYKLGPLMGKRTWGGVIGIRGGNGLIDGGYCTVPEFGLFDLDGNWVIENEGVHPDIEIANTPTRRAEAYDDQLSQAVDYILQKLEEEPMKLPDGPAGPPTPR